MSNFQHITLIAAFTHFWKWTELKHKPFCCTSSVSSTYWRANILLTALFAVSPSNSCTGAKPWSVITQRFVMTNTKGISDSLYCYAMTFCASRWERDHLGSLLWWLKPGSPCSHKHTSIQPRAAPLSGTGMQADPCHQHWHQPVTDLWLKHGFIPQGSWPGLYLCLNKGKRKKMPDSA